MTAVITDTAHGAYVEAGRVMDAVLGADAPFWGVVPRVARADVLDDETLLDGLHRATSRLESIASDNDDGGPAAGLLDRALDAVASARSRLTSGYAWIVDARSTLVRAVLPGVLDRRAVATEVDQLRARAALRPAVCRSTTASAFRLRVSDCAAARPDVAEDLERLLVGLSVEDDPGAEAGSGTEQRAGGTGTGSGTARSSRGTGTGHDRFRSPAPEAVLEWCRSDLAEALAVLEEGADNTFHGMLDLVARTQPFEVIEIDHRVERVLGSPGLALPDAGGVDRVFLAPGADAVERAFRLRHEGAPGHLLHFQSARAGLLDQYGMLFRDGAAREGWGVTAERAHDRGDRAASVRSARERVRRAVHGVVGMVRSTEGSEAAAAALADIRRDHAAALDGVGPELTRRVPYSYLDGAAEVGRIAADGFDAWEDLLAIGFVPAGLARALVESGRNETVPDRIAA